MPDLKRLPEGPHRKFLEALHELYRKAGMPGVQRTSEAIRDRDDLPATISHEAISRVLRGVALPRNWQKLESLILMYLDWDPANRYGGHELTGLRVHGFSDRRSARITEAPETPGEVLLRMQDLWRSAFDATGNVHHFDEILARFENLQQAERLPFLVGASRDHGISPVSIAAALMPKSPHAGEAILYDLGLAVGPTPDEDGTVYWPVGTYHQDEYLEKQRRSRMTCEWALPDCLDDISAYSSETWQGRDPYKELLGPVIRQCGASFEIVHSLAHGGPYAQAHRKEYFRVFAQTTYPGMVPEFAISLRYGARMVIQRGVSFSSEAEYRFMNSLMNADFTWEMFKAVARYMPFPLAQQVPALLRKHRLKRDAVAMERLLAAVAP
ncbi:hypothetical protein [Streptomyces albidoflavus]|uniref:hypothetical protein n=1 Tax=Streptomyces albidoflavus TaxID=1886 RepID=UPI003407055F